MNSNQLSLSFFIFFFLFTATNVTAQLRNSSFEISNDTLPQNPKHWEFKNNDVVQFSLSSQTKYSGLNAIQIDLSKNTTDKYYVFSQVFPFQGKKLQRVLVTYYLKSELEGTSGITWQALDKDGKQIGYTYSGMQDQETINTSEWEKHTLLMTIDEKCTSFFVGGYAKGKGKVWFDDILIVDFVPTDSKPSKEVKKYLNSFKKIVKKHSIYRDLLNWKEIESDLTYLSRGINTMEDLGAPKDYILNKLREVGDNHSFLSSKESFETSQQSQTTTAVPYSKLLENNIGYIYVPEFSSRNDSINVVFATKIQGLIKELDTQNNIKSWIVDLRENQGGNMHPMLAGLGPLTGEGTSGHFVSAKSKKSEAWFYKAGGFGVGKNITTQVENPYVLKQINPKIAVLISKKTSSSGEMTAVAFIGKENTTLFGQTSGGYTTTNADYKLPNGARLYLASGYVSDRNNKMYLKNIQPEIIVVEDVKEQDKTLEAAKKWLNN